MTVNVPLLRKTLEHIEAHPEEWDQKVWWCGSSGCFAGHAAQIAGADWVETGDSVYIHAVPDDNPLDTVIGLIPVPDRARRILGLSIDQSAKLFHSDNTLDDLRRIIAELIG